MRGLALFDHALTVGDSEIAEQARVRLFATAMLPKTSMR